MDAENYYFVRVDRTVGQLNLGLVQGGVTSPTVAATFPFVGGASYKVGAAFAVVLTANATHVWCEVGGAHAVHPFIRLRGLFVFDVYLDCAPHCTCAGAFGPQRERVRTNLHS